MNSHIVEKTMHSIKNIDRLTDLAAIDVYNTTHDTINKYEIMKEHATEEYTNESFYQESVLAGVLIGAGVLGVAISAFFIIKKIIDSKDSADSSVKSSDGKMVAAQVDLSDPKSTEKYLADLKARLEKLTETKSIKVTKSINKNEFESAEKQIKDWSDKLQEIIDNKHEATAIEKIIDEISISSVDASKIFVDKEMDASVADLAEILGLKSISSFASLLTSLKKQIDDVEKMVNNKKDKEAENAVEISPEHLTKLKNQNNAAAKLIATLKAKSKETLNETDKAVLGAINAETEAKKKDETNQTATGSGSTPESKPATGIGSDTPQNANPQAQSGETATPVAQNSGQNIPPSSTPENLNFQASGFNSGNPAEQASQPAPGANPQTAADSKIPNPVSGNQSVEPNLGTNFLNAVINQKQQQRNENLTQQFGSNTARENSNVENWINAANANNADAEPEKKPEDQVKTEPENLPTPTDQTSSDDEKITKLANELYRNPTDDNKRQILGDLNRLREGESSVITSLNDIKTTLLERLKNGQDSPSMSQAILDRVIYNYEATAKEFGINADYLKSYDKTVPTEAPNDNNADKSKSENENKERSQPTASDFENFKNPEVNPESQQRFNSEINNADKSSTQSVQSDEAALKQASLNRQAEEEMRNKQQIQNRFNAEINGSNRNPSVQSDEAALKQQAVLKQQADAKKAAAKEVNKYQPNINGTLSSDSEENKAAQWIANAQSHDQEGDSGSNLGTNFLNAVRNGKAKMDEQSAQPQPVQSQPEASQDTTNPGPDDEERAAQWIANAKANEVPETPATPAVDSTNNEFNYGANWLSSMQQAQKENEINNNINYLRDEGYNNDQIRDLLAKQGYDRNDVNTVLNMSDDQLKAIQDAINNNNADTITSQDHDAVPAPPQLPKKLPLEPETHIDLDAAAPANEVPAGVNQVNINDAEEAAKNNYLNTRIAKNPKLGYPSLEALNNAVDELIAMIKQNVAIGNDPSQYAVGVLHNIYNIASAKNKMALPFDKLAALKAVKQYIKYRMIRQGVGNYFAEMTENDIGYYNLIQEYKIEIIREEKLKMIQEQQG